MKKFTRKNLFFFSDVEKKKKNKRASVRSGWLAQTYKSGLVSEWVTAFGLRFNAQKYLVMQEPKFKHFVNKWLKIQLTAKQNINQSPSSSSSCVYVCMFVHHVGWLTYNGCFQGLTNFVKVSYGENHKSKIPKNKKIKKKSQKKNRRCSTGYRYFFF